MARFTGKVRSGDRHTRKQESHQRYTRGWQMEGDTEGAVTDTFLVCIVKSIINVLSSSLLMSDV